ncbi:MAG: HlyD family secretion protein [Gemmatimonadota bacterium]
MSTTTAPESPTDVRPAGALPPPPTPASGTRRRIVLGIVGVAAVIGLTIGFRSWRYAESHESTDNAQVDGNIIPVVSRVGGFVAEVRVQENGRVTAGDTLVILDDAEFRVRLAQAEADLEAARAISGGRGVSGQSEALVRSATSQRESFQAQVTAARANLAKAEADLGRMEELVAKQIVSRQQLDAAQLAVQSSRANLESAERQLAGASAGVDNAQVGTRLARARLASAQAIRDNAALQLTYTRILAPSGGYVSRKQVDPGQLVQAGQPVLTVVDEDGVWVSANFKETQLADLRVGQAVDIDVDAYAGCLAHGTVESVSPATGAKFALIPPDNATGNFTKVVQRIPVRIAVTSGCAPDRPLRPGMSVTAHVDTH